MIKKIFYFLGVLSFSMASLIAYPPPVPSAGIIERELEKEYEAQPLPQDREIPDIQIEIPKEKLQIPENISVLIQHVIFEGNVSISSQELTKCIASELGKKISLKEIYALCERIDHCYAQKGFFLARAYPPPQEINQETLTIRIIEGCLGNVQVEGNKYYTKAFIQGYFKPLKGKSLRYNEFLHALMLLNDNQDLNVGVVFQKGEEFGCADVIVRVDDARPVHLYLNGNNYGRDLTTNARAGGRLDWGNCIVQGDQFSVAEVIGFPVNALYFTDVVYRFPLNHRGASLEAGYLYSQFKIEELTRLHLKGRSQIATLKVNQALVRSRFLSVDLFSYFDYKQIQNIALGHVTSYDKLRVLTIGALLDHSAFSQGRDYVNIRFAAGIPHFLGGLKSVSTHSSRRGGGGRFFMLNVDYDRMQNLPKSCFLYAHASGQYSPNKLTQPQQLYIGGSDTVRGFPLAYALGDSGYYLNLEFRCLPFIANKKFFSSNKRWKDIIQFDVFLDHGGAFLQSIENTFLWGSGLGVRVNAPYGLSLSIDVGFPLNHRDHTRGAFTYIKLTGRPF